MAKKYAHYCKKCRKYYACTHPDPEKTKAICPLDGNRLTLHHGGTLEDIKTEVHLGPSEIGSGVIKYQQELIHDD